MDREENFLIIDEYYIEILVYLLIH